jgi:subtilisin family serine protease
MITLTNRVGHLSKIIILCLFIALPVNVFALENPINSTLQTENSQINVSLSSTQNGIDTSPFPPVQPSIRETSSTPLPPPGLPNSTNLILKESLLQGRVNANNHDIITDSRTGQKYVKDRVIVRFKSQKNAGVSISQEKIRMAHANVGAKLEKEFNTGGTAGLQLVQLPNGTDVQSAIIAYESNPDVLYAEPDYVLSILPDQTGSIINDINSATILSMANDEFFSDQWSFHNTGQTGGTPGADINAPGAWDISTGSNSVVVAVIDTGVLYNHSDLSANIWNNTDEIPGNGIDDDGNGYTDDVRGWNFVANTSDPIDDNHHGTHVSGTIGAVGNNAIGVAGVNWHVKIMPLKAFDSAGFGDTSDAITAIEYANANGASVISNSWGGGSYSQGLKDAIDASPAVVVCAAGNNANDNDINPVYPASYNSTNIISVAATDHNDIRALFSNFGLSSVDLAAPGTNIWSTYLDGTYALMSGTSMATPHVSGVVALVKSVNPSLTAVQIKNIILSTVDSKDSLNGKVASGGRLNAYKAVLASNPPIADFTGTPRSGTIPLTVAFSDHSANLPTTWLWSFGDGNTLNSTVQNPVHTYLTPGNFTVSLTASNAAGNNTVTRLRYINITSGISKTGVYRPGVGFYLKMDNGNTWQPSTDQYLGWDNTAIDLPIAGDWNGDGRAETGVYRPGVGFYLKMDNGSTWTPSTDSYLGWDNAAGDLPVAGDWNGDGRAETGVYRPGSGFYLKMDNGNTWQPSTDQYLGWDNTAIDLPIAGDWNMDGRAETGVYRPGVGFYLKMDNGSAWNSSTDLSLAWDNAAGDRPIAGDWNGDGRSETGIYRPGSGFYLKMDNGNTWQPSTDLSLAWDNANGDLPIAGTFV